MRSVPVLCGLNGHHVAGFAAAVPFKHFIQFYLILVPVVSDLTVWDSQKLLLMKVLFIDDIHLIKAIAPQHSFFPKRSFAP